MPNNPITPREQELVDICFALVLTATSQEWREHFASMDNKLKSRWVAEQLRKSGFPTMPMGSSWGVLVNAK